MPALKAEHVLGLFAYVANILFGIDNFPNAFIRKVKAGCQLTDRSSYGILLADLIVSLLQKSTISVLFSPFLPAAFCLGNINRLTVHVFLDFLQQLAWKNFISIDVFHPGSRSLKCLILREQSLDYKQCRLKNKIVLRFFLIKLHAI